MRAISKDEAKRIIRYFQFLFRRNDIFFARISTNSEICPLFVFSLMDRFVLPSIKFPQVCHRIFTKEKHSNSMIKSRHYYSNCVSSSFKFRTKFFTLVKSICFPYNFFLSFLTELCIKFFTKQEKKKKNWNPKIVDQRDERESERKSKMLKSSDVINHPRNEVTLQTLSPVSACYALSSKMHLPAAVWWDFILSRILSPVSPNRGRPLISLAGG